MPHLVGNTREAAPAKALQGNRIKPHGKYDHPCLWTMESGSKPKPGAGLRAILLIYERILTPTQVALADA